MEKAKILSCKAVLLLIFFIVGCSKNEIPADQEEFLTALIDEQIFSVNKLNGSIKCEKQLTEFGTINLSVQVISTEGESIEFLIQNYLGKQLYLIESGTAEDENFIKEHWLTYSRINPQEEWSSLYDYYSTGELQNYIEITEDNGSYIVGHFSSENYQFSGPVAKLIKEGAFNLRVGR